MEMTGNLYDITVSTGDPLYVVSVVILRFGATENEIKKLLEQNGIMPQGLAFDKPNVNHFTDISNNHRIEVYRHL